jgi:ketosteroid isomerase-like protein
MSPREIVSEMLRSSDGGRFDAFHARLESDCEWVNPMAQARGADHVVAALAAYADAFPDRRHELSLVLEAGSTVAVEGEWVATHAAPLRTPDGEIPATGRTVRVPFAGVIHVRGDRVASAHVYLDPLGFMAQLGIAPAPAAA